MSSSSRLSSSVRILSIGVVAFALAALQGCSPTMTASSAKDPASAFPGGLGHGRADAPTHVEPRVVSESRAVERIEARSRDSRGVGRHEYCRRCSN